MLRGTLKNISLTQVCFFPHFIYLFGPQNHALQLKAFAVFFHNFSDHKILHVCVYVCVENIIGRQIDCVYPHPPQMDPWEGPGPRGPIMGGSNFGSDFDAKSPKNFRPSGLEGHGSTYGGSICVFICPHTYVYIGTYLCLYIRIYNVYLLAIYL